VKVIEKGKVYTGMAALICLGIVLYLYSPEKSGFYPPCIFHKITGLYCPGCGTTRALHALLHGRILDAISYNAAILILLPSFLWWYSLYVLQEFSIPWKNKYDFPPMFFTALLALVILFGILRNVPVYPLRLLAP